MTNWFLLLLALFLPPQWWTATVTGHILDREGKPLVEATVQHTNVGTLEQRVNGGTVTTSWEFYQNLGTNQANQTLCEEAVQSFAKGVEVAEKLLPNAADPAKARESISDMLIAAGDCYTQRGKVEEAVAFYEKAAAVALQPAKAHYRACNTLTNWNKFEAAIEECNQAIANDPTQWEFYQMLGVDYYTLGRAQESLKAFEQGVALARKAMQATPDSGKAKTGLGEMLSWEGSLLEQMNRPDDAIRALSQATEVSAYPQMEYLHLCRTYYNLKRIQDAVSACDKAIALDPTLSETYYVKASILFDQGHEEHGKYVAPPGISELLHKYLQVTPYGPDAGAVWSMLEKLHLEGR